MAKVIVGDKEYQVADDRVEGIVSMIEKSSHGVPSKFVELLRKAVLTDFSETLSKEQTNMIGFLICINDYADDELTNFLCSIELDTDFSDYLDGLGDSAFSILEYIEKGKAIT